MRALNRSAPLPCEIHASDSLGPMYNRAMVEEHNSVQLQVADGRNLAVDGAYRWSQEGPNFSHAESAINHLNFDYDRLVTAQSVFRIVDLWGAVLMEDSAIRARIRKR